MDPIAAKAFLNSPSSLDPTNVPGSNAATTLLNDTNSTGGSLLVPFLREQRNRSAAQNPVAIANAGNEAKYQEENKSPGIPLDTETGAGAWDRFMLGFARQKKDQLAYLQDKYGPENIKLDTEGDFVVRVKEGDKARDIKVHPRNMTAGDLMDVAAVAPELIGSLIAIRAGRGIPKVGGAGGFLGALRDSVAAGAGAETTGALKDITTGLAIRGDADVGNIAADRSKQAVVDTGLGVGTYGAGRFLNKALFSPISGKAGPVQFDLAAAKEHFKQNYGIDVPLSVAEASGNPIAGRMEAFTEMQPGGVGPFAALKGKQEDALRELQGIMMGKTPVEDVALGEQLIKHLEDKLAPLEQAAASSAQAVKEGATQQVKDIATGLSTPDRQLLLSKTGQDIRDAVIAKRDAQKAIADKLYADVAAAPGGTGRVLDGTDLQTRLKDIISKLPGVESEKTIPTGIVGPTGKPITTTVKVNELLEKSAPDKLLSRIREIVDKKNPQFSLTDLQQLRRDIYDDISRGEGVPGLGVHYLNDFANAVTQTIDSEVSKMPSGALKTALEAANKHYKENVVPFNRTGLTELFRRADEPGFVPSDQIVEQIFGSGKALNNYNVLKETLGPADPAFVKLKRSILDNLIEKSRTGGTDILDANALVNTFDGFRKANPEMAADVFGTKLGDIFKEAKRISVATDQPGAFKISDTDLAALLRDPSPTNAKLADFIRKQKVLDETYRNSIMRDVSQNKLPGSAIVPEEFVSRFVNNPKVSVDDIKKVMGLLSDNQGLVDDLRAKTVEQLFRNAGRNATAGDINKLMAGDPTRILTGTGVYKQIESPAVRQKVQEVLGPEIYGDLDQYIKLLAGIEQKFSESGYRIAGGMAVGEKMGQLEKGQIFKYMKGAAASYIVSYGLTNPLFRRWLSQLPKGENPGYIMTALSSPVFLQQVAKDFPGAPGAALIRSIKEGMDKWIRADAEKHPPQDQTGAAQRKQLMQDYLHGRTNALP